ncbi:L,D-transpeptidase [Luteolibacter yonseiensis]|uniref:L,D-transpeptidase n=1 Tax=Luteolibacter yonseiensis TaxID=1144680 RepID=A0A934R4D7_9BACT|nr:L,D-transpeptidase [Luteolibacter yonseiensis]MBK1814969.1 L,D-transpeptidase [Luteolibacter yonseiensis]
MISLSTVAQITAALATLLLASCANQKPAEVTKDGKKVFVNPYPAGTYDHFKAEPTYPKTYSVWKNDELLSRTNAENSSILISLEKQRGFLLNGEDVVLDYPICSGIPSRPTPPGTFYILEKVVDKRSNKYGRIYDAAGELVNGDADVTLDPIPEGGKFEGASMRYWMRLTNDGVGHHIGPVKRRPASHACIRGPSATMPVVYSKVKPGTRVVVQ